MLVEVPIILMNEARIPVAFHFLKMFLQLLPLPFPSRVSFGIASVQERLVDGRRAPRLDVLGVAAAAIGRKI